MNSKNEQPVATGRSRARRQSSRRVLRNSRRGAALLLAGALTATAGSAGADTYRTSTAASSYYVSAPVVSVSPVTSERTVQHPIRQCTRESFPRESYRDDYHYERRQRNENLFLPGLFGGIVGGLIGNQFGGGNGKKALTIAGAIAGSSIARDAARHNRRQPREVCHTSYQTEVIQSVTAYDVTYEYAGQLFEKRMTEHPGNSVRVRVALEPGFGET